MLLRYKALDRCFKMRSKKWTLEMLIAYCSECVGESLSKRSVQSDIKFLRDSKEGYNAPIIVIDKKYYTYQDKKFTILDCDIPLRIQEQFDDSVSFLEELSKFSKISCNIKETQSSFDNLKFNNQGFTMECDVYSPSEIRNIMAFINKHSLSNGDSLLKDNMINQQMLINDTLSKLLRKIDNHATLVDAKYSEEQIPSEFQQTLELPLKKREIPKNLTLWGYPASEKYEAPNKRELFDKTFAVQIFLKDVDENTGAMRVIGGSHQRELSPLETRLITDNVSTTHCEVKKGGVVFYKPLLIKGVCSSESPKKKQSIILWFSSYKLPVQYIWNIE